MMKVRRMNGSIDLIIPKENINDNLTAEEVQQWVEIGNSLIFPAIIEELKVPNKLFGRCGCDPRLNQFQGLKIKAAPGNYKQVILGLPELFLFSMEQVKDDETFHFRIMKARGMVEQNDISRAPLDADIPSNYQIIETGENLKAFMVRTIAEQKNHPKESDCYKITIDYSQKYFGSHQKLAILSFYRFLWSNLYNGIVVDTLRLVNLGIDPWTALYAALSREDRNYKDYYSLLNRRGFVPMQNVISRLRIVNTVNGAFSIQSDYSEKPFRWEDDNNHLKEEVERFIDVPTPQIIKKAKVKKYMCVEPTKLLSNKLYDGWVSNGLLYVTGSDWSTRGYKLSRFVVVEE